MPQVLDWQNAADPQEVVRRAVDALTAGQIVAFPTETVYGLAASVLVSEAIERLQQSKGRPDNKPLTLALADASNALDWVPTMSILGRRLTRRCWPGPVTLVFDVLARSGDDGTTGGLLSQLPEAVQRRICPTGSLGLRVPAHEAILKAMSMLSEPLVLTSANRAGEPPATTAEQVMQAVGEDAALVIDDGPSRFGQASTVVQVEGTTWKVLREGVVSEETLRKHAACLIVFVCTGNTCRSPLAEALCKKMVAERLGCAPAELPERGFCVHSAGLAATMGGEPSPEAVETARSLGADLGQHRSRPLTLELAYQADYLVCMTHGHEHLLIECYPDLGCQPRLLSASGEDIADPIGCDQHVYDECAQQIQRHLEEFVAEVIGH